MIPKLKDTETATIEKAMVLLEQVPNSKFKKGFKKHFAPNGKISEKSIYWFFPWTRVEVEYNNRGASMYARRIWNELFEDSYLIFNDNEFYPLSKSRRY
jgi:hypothetical protein